MTQTILIVEDDPVTILLYKALLSEGNYKILTAENAKNAIDILTHEEIDLIIEDLSLPDLNGVQLLHCVRQLPHCDKLPVIILSGSSGRIESAKHSSEHFEAFLHKPVDKAILLAEIKRLLG